MIVSTTEIQNYMRCERMWGLTSFNTMSLTRAVHRVALETGTLWHQVMADWLLHPELDPVDIFEARYVESLQSARESYKRRNGMYPMSIEMDPIKDAGAMVKAMVINYRDYYKKPLPDGFRCVSPEQTIVIPIPDAVTRCLKCEGIGLLDSRDCDECGDTGFIEMQLECTLDAMLADERDQLFVLERKTYGSRPKEISLHHNFQFKTYTWATTRLDMGYVAGLLYDGVWKRDQPPRGRTFDDLFLRMPILFSEHELQEIENLLTIKSIEMYQSAHSMDLTMASFNRRWEGCYDCGVEDLCTAISRDEDFDYLRNKHYVIRERTAAFVSEGNEEGSD